MSKMKSVKLMLEYPIEFQGATIQELTVRRPKGKDMRFLPKGDVGVEDMFPFFACLIGTEEGVLDEMDASDFKRLGEIVDAFLSGKKVNPRLTLVTGGK